MKSFLLAALVAAGLACTASDADAQLLRGRRGMSYNNYSTYSYPYSGYSTYSSPYSYSVPSYYNGGVVTSSYTPYTTNGGVITSGGTYYNYPSYSSYPSYYSTPNYTGFPAYSGYSNYYTPSGVYSNGMYMGGRRGWRW
jgi:hypothetical protein